MEPISQNKILTNIKMLEFTDYKTALSKEGEIYLARDLNEKGIKDYCCCSTEQLRHYLDDDYNLYEILKEFFVRTLKYYLINTKLSSPI